MKKNQEQFEPMSRYSWYREKKYSWEGRKGSVSSLPEHLILRHTMIDEEEREWYLYSPESVRSPAPVVISCHGGNEDGWTQFMETSWDSLADEKGCLIVYPTSRTSQWDCDADSKDERLLLKIIEELKSEKIADEQRIYLHGFSRGAMFGQCFAMRNSALLAGISLISGPAPSGWLLKEDNSFKTENVKALPVYLSMGENDNSLEIEFTGWRQEESSMSDIAGFNRKYWIHVNHCQEAPQLSFDSISDFLIYHGVAPLVFRSILGMGHGQLLDEPQIIWERIFAPFYRDHSGLIIRNGIDKEVTENYILCRNHSQTYLGSSGYFVQEATPILEKRTRNIREEGGKEIIEKETVVYLPVSLMEALGYRIENNKDTWYLENRDHRIEVNVDSCFAVVDGRWLSQKYATRTENGMLYIANKGVLEEIGYKVSVSGEMVLIHKRGSGLSEKTAVATEAYFPLVIEKERK